MVNEALLRSLQEQAKSAYVMLGRELTDEQCYFRFSKMEYDCLGDAIRDAENSLGLKVIGFSTILPKDRPIETLQMVIEANLDRKSVV